DGRMVAFEHAAGEWSLSVWDLAGGKRESTSAAGVGFAAAVLPVVDPKGRGAAVVHSGKLAVFDLTAPSAAPRTVPVWSGSGPGVVAADGSWAAFALDREVVVFETTGWTRRHSLPVAGRVSRFDLTADGRLIAAGAN